MLRLSDVQLPSRPLPGDRSAIGLAPDPGRSLADRPDETLRDCLRLAPPIGRLN